MFQHCSNVFLHCPVVSVLFSDVPTSSLPFLVFPHMFPTLPIHVPTLFLKCSYLFLQFLYIFCTFSLHVPTQHSLLIGHGRMCFLLGWLVGMCRNWGMCPGVCAWACAWICARWCGAYVPDQCGQTARHPECNTYRWYVSDRFGPSGHAPPANRRSQRPSPTCAHVAQMCRVHVPKVCAIWHALPN